MLQHLHIPSIIFTVDFQLSESLYYEIFSNPKASNYLKYKDKNKDKDNFIEISLKFLCVCNIKSIKDNKIQNKISHNEIKKGTS